MRVFLTLLMLLTPCCKKGVTTSVVEKRPLPSSVISQEDDCTKMITSRGIYVLVHAKRIDGTVSLVRSVGEKEIVASIMNELNADSKNSIYNCWNDGILVIRSPGEERYVPVHDGRVCVEYDSSNDNQTQISVNCLLDAAANIEWRRSFD